MKLRRYDESIEPLTRALDLDSKRAGARISRAISLMGLHRNREALEDCERYIAAKPGEMDGYYVKALVYEEMWEPDDGLRSLERAIELCPTTQASFLAAKARMLCQAKRPKEALTAIDAAVAAGIPETDLSNHRAYQLVEAGRYAEALPLLEEFIQEFPSRDWYYCRARAYEGLGDDARAQADRQSGDQLSQRTVNELRGTGIPRTVVLIQAGRELFAPGDRDGGALVLLTFDDRLNADTPRLLRLAKALHELRGKPLSNDPVLRAATNAICNDSGQTHRRQPLPVELTEGIKCYAADLGIYRSLLPEGRLNEKSRVLTVIAEPGDTGRMEMCPLPGSPGQ